VSAAFRWVDICILPIERKLHPVWPTGSSAGPRDPARLSAAQLTTLAHATARELAGGLSLVAREVRLWRARASAIPDTSIREDALSSLANKRGHTDGAALFWIVPRARCPQLLRLLVAYEIAWDFLDSTNEHGATAGQANGRQLHLALIDALDPSRPISDYYRHHPWRDDGGYLRSLVELCRAICIRLPAYERVRTRLVAEASRAQVLSINHDLDPVQRDAALREWAASEHVEDLNVDWFELTGAASASLTVHALLAVCAEPAYTDADIARVHGAYSPWISAATTMLDSYVDQSEDSANGDHSYIAHYRTPAEAQRRVSELIQRSLAEARALPNGERHALLVACMIAMYLSKDSARAPQLRETTASFIDAGGSLTKILLPILRLWRIAYAQRSA
jgi:tetraprenyl-beta-curcumene synthase